MTQGTATAQLWAELSQSRLSCMRGVRTILIALSLSLPGTAAAQTEIHKCTDAEGSIVYSQLPCAPQKPVERDKSEPVEEAEIATPGPSKREPPVAENSQEQAEPDANRAACKKRYREAIDAIDAEIGREYSPEKGDQYKQRLLALTRKLRQC